MQLSENIHNKIPYCFLTSWKRELPDQLAKLFKETVLQVTVSL